MLTERGMFASVEDYAGTLAHVRATWRDGVMRFGWAGAYCYSGLEDYPGRHPGFRAGPDGVHGEFCAAIEELYQDLDATISGRAIELRNRRAYALRWVTAALVPAAEQGGSLSVGDIPPGGTAVLTLAPDARPPRKIEVATHGGLACRCSLVVR